MSALIQRSLGRRAFQVHMQDTDYYDCHGGTLGTAARLFVYLTSTNGQAAISTHLVDVDGRVKIGVEDPMQWYPGNSFEDFFSRSFSGDRRPLDRTLGFDFTTETHLYNENGAPKADIQLLTSPDQEGPSEKITVICEKKFRQQ